MADRIAHHGRGAQSGQVSTRSNLATREEDGDWRDVQDSVDGPVEKLRTTVTEEHPRSILSFNASPDIPFDRSVNAYRGCDHPHGSCVAQRVPRFMRIWPLSFGSA
jgi:hypothetical protein